MSDYDASSSVNTTMAANGMSYRGAVHRNEIGDKISELIKDGLLRPETDQVRLILYDKDVFHLYSGPLHRAS